MSHHAAYGKKEYWDKRYTEDPEPFDWYQKYDALKGILNKWCPKDARTLVVGCGNSKLSPDMKQDDYEALVNIDISPVVIEAMKAENPDMEYRTLDVTDMSCFEDESFGSVLDKGTLDALLCGEGSAENADKMCSEISRLLRPGGVFVLITYGSPKSRIPYLDNEKFSWEISKFTVDKPTVGIDHKEKDVHYVYCMRKK